jgi:hypothetical protein
MESRMATATGQSQKECDRGEGWEWTVEHLQVHPGLEPWDLIAVPGMRSRARRQKVSLTSSEEGRRQAALRSPRKR